MNSLNYEFKTEEARGFTLAGAYGVYPKLEVEDVDNDGCGAEGKLDVLSRFVSNVDFAGTLELETFVATDGVEVVVVVAVGGIGVTLGVGTADATEE